MPAAIRQLTGLQIDGWGWVGGTESSGEEDSDDNTSQEAESPMETEESDSSDSSGDAGDDVWTQ